MVKQKQRQGYVKGKTETTARLRQGYKELQRGYNEGKINPKQG